MASFETMEPRFLRTASLHALLVPLLVDDALALQRPVVALYRPGDLLLVTHPLPSNKYAYPCAIVILILTLVPVLNFFEQRLDVLIKAL